MANSLEEQLFSWSDWDQADTAAFQYYNVELKVSIGEFVSGTKFDWALFDVENAELTLGTNEGVEHQFNLCVSAVSKT